jgi:hypothetical protein
VAIVDEKTMISDGANVNRLMSSAPEDLEKLAGLARLTGVPVRVDTVKPAAPLVH